MISFFIMIRIPLSLRLINITDVHAWKPDAAVIVLSHYRLVHDAIT